MREQTSEIEWIDETIEILKATEGGSDAQRIESISAVLMALLTRARAQQSLELDFYAAMPVDRA
ncbi:hypothetical protein ASG25_11090 [Rhizobium sp. Leaf384]|uniref:hypothetical protein n=1 Tax=unclassified Rhizobium TaxID=2613769 RepID=UPI00071274D5|nr:MULTISPECIES: hypothetical protein [unclassified Rhizobium]KQR68707.1 hypothetical protein ASG03_05415 [Rhizobium sp. Leaf341]KQS79115.1 hypothetical protein ASG25_11090 [Rhizobium sp. Leaf384]KQS82682.1 hypothetical protein ASG58_04905 [Rhizobium sp. Leaf383]